MKMRQPSLLPSVAGQNHDVVVTFMPKYDTDGLENNKNTIEIAWYVMKLSRDMWYRRGIHSCISLANTIGEYERKKSAD